MDKKVSLFGMTLQSPFVIGSGPISYAAEGMIRAHAQGAGAVVTKTIRTLAAENPYPHIALSGRDSMINAEKWTDFPPERWIEQEIPQAKAAGVTVIASIGHTEQEAALWVGRASRAGADMIELVSYTEQTILPMVRTARTLTDKPILVKISPNWSDPVSAALQTLDCGADGITAMDSIGPVLRIDIRTRRPLVGGAGGSGWLTGGAIKPITLRYVAELAQRTDKPIIGLGGVMTAEDAAEMMMAGAAAVGICTAPMLKGIEYISKLCSGIEKLAGSLGFARTADMTGAALSSLGEKENMRQFSFAYSPEICIDCRKCVIVCPYQARELNERVMSLDTELCRFCGLCASVCPTSALRIVPAE